MIDVSHEGGTTVLYMTRTERGNTLKSALVEALISAVETCISDPTIDTLLLTSQDADFCSGFEILNTVFFGPALPLFWEHAVSANMWVLSAPWLGSAQARPLMHKKHCQKDWQPISLQQAHGVSFWRRCQLTGPLTNPCALQQELIFAIPTWQRWSVRQRWAGYRSALRNTATHFAKTNWTKLTRRNGQVENCSLQTIKRDYRDCISKPY